MNILTNKYFIFILRLILGITFIWAAYDKIAHPDEFARIIYYYKVVPADLINIFALLLPALELITGVLLIIGFWEKSANLLIAAMLSMFIAALVFAITKGIDIECGCFSTTTHAKSAITSLIIRDILMLIACLLIYLAKESWLALDSTKKHLA